MSIPQIDQINEVPLRSTASNNTIYRQAVEAFFVALSVLSQQLRAMITALNNAIATINGQADQVSDDAAAAQGAYEALVLAAPTTPLNGASTSAVTIGTGTKTFAATTGGARWRIGMWLDIRSGANSSNFMAGPITSLSPLTISVPAGATGGSGSYSDWVIYPTVAPSPAPNIIAATKTDTASTTSTAWVDTGLEVTIALTDASHRVLLSAAVMATGTGTDPTTFRFTRAGNPLLQGDAGATRTRAHFAITDAVPQSASGQAVDAPGSVGPHTYKLQWRTPSGTSYLNRSASDGDNAGQARMASTLTASEIGAAS